MALFGSAFVFGKLVLNTNVPPLLFGSLRMLVVVICLLPFFNFKIPRENLKVASRDTNKLNIVTTNFFMASIGFVVLILLSFFFEGNTMIILKNIQLDMWFFIIYSGLIVSIGAHMSLFYLYKFYPVGKVLPFYALFPVFGLIQTFIIFNEIPSLIMTLGGIIVIGSVFLIQKVK